MPFGMSMHGLDQPGLEVPRHPLVTLSRTVLPDQLARPALGDPMTADQAAHRVTSTGRAHQSPRCKSFNIEISRACSATIRFSLAFSCSSAFSRCASSSFNAPYSNRRRKNV